MSHFLRFNPKHVIPIGTAVRCRGTHARDFSLYGEIETIVPENPTGVYRYGVRLENGNYHLFPPENVQPI